MADLLHTPHLGSDDGDDQPATARRADEKAFRHTFRLSAHKVLITRWSFLLKDRYRVRYRIDRDSRLILAFGSGY